MTMAWLVAAATAIAWGAAFGGADCATKSDADRARCELEQRALRECAGRTGDALAACRRAVAEPRPDCRRLPEGYARNKCEDENRRADIEVRCGALAGDELRRCYGEVTSKAAPR
jgi:hypothetical protein